MSYLELHGLTKRFGPRTAVDRLDLHIDAGEIYVLLGPNGAGKTTTLRMIAGITPPTEGDIVVDGIHLADSPVEVKSRFYFIPDRPYLYEKLTGREYLEFLGNVYQRGSVESVAGFLRELKIDDRLDHLIESYSHGMRQKLLLSAAIMLAPPLLIIDEPLVGLDPRSAMILREKIIDYANAGRQALISTHQLALAEAIATRVGILHLGRLLAEDTAAVLRDRAKSASLEEAFLAMTETDEPD